MTMMFVCDACGQRVSVPQDGALDSASVSDAGSPPKGWRTLYTILEEHNGTGGVRSHSGEVSHTCADCNADVPVEQRLQWDNTERVRRLRLGPHDV